MLFVVAKDLFQGVLGVVFLLGFFYSAIGNFLGTKVRVGDRGIRCGWGCLHVDGFGETGVFAVDDGCGAAASDSKS